MPNPDAAPRNTFLETLPERERDRLLAVGEVVSVAAAEILHESGRATRYLWFPLDCVCSLATCMEDGSEAEVAVIGREGVVGLTALLGTDTTWSTAAVQVGGSVLRVPAGELKVEAQRSARVRLLLQRFMQALLVQTSQTAACNRFHTIEQRLARFLLSLNDRVSGDEIAITHERLATVLGSLRPGVTLAAGRLQEQGSIRYTRGKLRVLDRKLLEASACECYEAVASEYERLMGAEALRGLESEESDDTLRDVNSQLLLAALREQERRERAEEARDQAVSERSAASIFLESLSAELRRPLEAIIGWADLLSSGELDAHAIVTAAETIRRNVEAQTQLASDMQELAALRTGRLELHMQPLDLSTIVRSAIAACRTAADSAGIAVTSITGSTAAAHADPVRLRQLLDHVLASAVHAALPGSAIELTITTAGETVQIDVRESGRTESPLLPHTAVAPHTDAATRRVQLALGLAIARELVTLHGGKLDVRSGDAASAAITLPRLLDAEPPSAPRPTRVPLSGKRAGHASAPSSHSRGR